MLKKFISGFRILILAIVPTVILFHFHNISCFLLFDSKPAMTKVFIETHCMKSVRIRSYSGAHFPTFGLNKERYSTYAGKCGPE